MGTRGFRHFVFQLFDDAASTSILGKLISGFIVMTIALSTVTFVMESMPEYRSRPDECDRLKQAGLPLTVEACEPVPYDIFYTIEAVCIGIFTVDYLARVLTVSSRAPSENCLRHLLAYARQPLNIIDVLAVLPF